MSCQCRIYTLPVTRPCQSLYHLKRVYCWGQPVSHFPTYWLNCGCVVGKGANQTFDQIVSRVLYNQSCDLCDNQLRRRENLILPRKETGTSPAFNKTELVLNLVLQAPQLPRLPWHQIIHFEWLRILSSPIKWGKYSWNPKTFAENCTFWLLVLNLAGASCLSSRDNGLSTPGCLDEASYGDWAVRGKSTPGCLVLSRRMHRATTI